MEDESRNLGCGVVILLALLYWGYSAYKDHTREQAVATEEAGASADAAHDRITGATNEISALKDRVDSLERKESDLEDRLQKANIPQ